jgi:hypothetical protein
MEGASVAGTYWTSVVRRILTGEFRTRASTTAGDSPTSRPPTGAANGPAVELKLASKPQTLDRMVAIRPDSIAVVFEPQHPPRIRFPGETLKPGLFPGLHPLQVVVFTTGSVSLDVTVGPLTTVDGHVLDRAKIRLAVQLNHNDHFAALAELAADVGSDLERQLLQRVQNEVASEVHAAVRMNRLTDLRRQTLESVLADRWLPRTFASGALLRRSFSVLDAAWPDAPKPVAPATAGPDRRSDESRETADSRLLDLTMDARLRRLWADHADADLRGIAGAKAHNSSTVVAVPTREPGAYEGSRLREAFGRFYDDRGVKVVAAVADSYDDLVRAWFKQVDGSPARLVSVQFVEKEGLLRIAVDSDLRSSAERAHGVSVGTQSDRDALRQLLPHQRVEFVAPAQTSS